MNFRKLKNSELICLKDALEYAADDLKVCPATFDRLLNKINNALSVGASMNFLQAIFMRFRLKRESKKQCWIAEIEEIRQRLLWQSTGKGRLELFERIGPKLAFLEASQDLTVLLDIFYKWTNLET